jgi:uncharacterized protein YdhG (YjbR/CyaY superfamily)
MPSHDDYLEGVAEPERSALRTLRAHVHAAFPDVEECFAYGMPAFRVDGITVAGYQARKQGCSYYPMSGSVLDGFDVVALGYSRSKGAMQFPADAPPSQQFVEQLIRARLAQA